MRHAEVIDGGRLDGRLTLLIKIKKSGHEWYVMGKRAEKWLIWLQKGSL